MMSIAGTHNPILAASNDLLAIVTLFNDSGEQTELQQSDFRQMVDDAFADYSECLRLQQCSKDDSDLGKYALAAFIDELVMSSNWDGKLAWMANTLQWQYFGEHRGGEGYFNRLAELRQQGSEKVDLLELYYLCLELGFQGMYRVFQNDKLVSLKRDIKHLIERYRQYPDLQLSAASTQAPVLNKRKLPYWKIGLIMAGILLLLYSVLNIAISNSASNSDKQLSDFSTSIKTISQEQHYNGGGK